MHAKPVRPIMLKFRTIYFIFATILFSIEVFIALFIHDTFIRPYLGDFLVVILIYCFVRSFVNVDIFATAVCVLLFSYTVELLQYFKIVELLNLQNFKLARIIIGTSFAWADMLAYTLGIVSVLWIENFTKQTSIK